MVRRVGIAAAAGLWLVAAVAGTAFGHVASGSFDHAIATSSLHSAGTGSFNCAALWPVQNGIHQSYDTKTHSGSLWQRDYYSSSSSALSWTFSAQGTTTFKPKRYHRLDAATSQVSGVHFYWDLVYPRYEHGLSMWCSG